MVRFASLFLFAFGSIWAQSPQTPPASSAFQPTYFVGVGTSWNQSARAWNYTVDYAQRISTNVYSFTAADTTPKGATSTRTGIATAAFQSGRWAGIIIGTAGAQTTPTSTLGTLAADGFVTYDIGDLLNKGKSHVYLMLGVEELTVATEPNQTVLMFRIGRGFSPSK